MRKDENTPPKEVNATGYDYLKHMDTTKLQALLQQESFFSNDENYNVELIQQIMNILEEREPTLEDLDVETSLKDFRSQVVPGIAEEESIFDPSINKQANVLKKHSRRSLRFALVAAVLTAMLGSTAIASAFGFNFWEYVIRWGKDTFQIGDGYEVKSDSEASDVSEGDLNFGIADENSYTSIEDAMKAFGDPILTLGWVPDRFTFMKAKISNNPIRKSLNIIYQFDDTVLMYNVVTYQSSEEASYSFEKNVDSGETLTLNGIDHYLMNNEDQYQAVWINGDSVYSINGNVTAEEITRILKSIYD